ncbi:hypothetical protein V1264_015159 [Littorina saxatilis]|uniref:Uncharacterized protein n=1 Tax=Littorina saxatilis TaxID=31220 RepID=A0AAN9BL39_9CAEN
MGDSLPAINVDQLTDSVNNAVHGNVLPPLPLLPLPPSLAAPPPSSLLPSPGFPDGAVRLLPASGLPPLSVFSQLPTFPLQPQASGTITNASNISANSAANLDNHSSDSPPSAPTPAVSSTITAVTATTPLTATTASACTSSSSNGSSSVVSSSSFPSPQSVPVNMPGCPPMFIMFSLRLPVSDPLAQGGSGEAAAPSASAPPGPRLPHFPPFPLLLPFLPPPQDGCPQRPLLPFSDLATSVAHSSLPSALPLPPGSFPQGLPLPPLPLQLPSSLPLLPLPPQSSSVTQGDFPLPPLLLQPPVSVSGSLPLPPFLPPPSSNVAQFSCPLPLTHCDGQASLSLPPFPPRSYAAFVQSGVPLTSLSTSFKPLPPNIPLSVFEGSATPSQEACQTVTVQSGSGQNLSSFGLDKTGAPSFLVASGTSSTQNFAPLPPPPPGFPLLPPLPTSSSAAQGFPLLPPLSVPSQMSFAAEAGFPLHVSIPLPPPPPLPFSLPVGSGSLSQPPPLYVSVAGQSTFPPFASQALPPLPFSVEPLPPPPSSLATSSPLLPDNQHTEAESSTAEGGEDELETDKNSEESSDESSDGDDSAEASTSPSPEVRPTREEAMCVESDNDDRAAAHLMQSEDVDMSAEKEAEPAHCNQQLDSASCVQYVINNNISTLCSAPSGDKSQVLCSAITQSDSKSSSSQHCSFVQLSDVMLDPSDSSKVLGQSDSCTTIYSSAIMSAQESSCGLSVSSQSNTAGKLVFETLRPVQSHASSEHHLPTHSFYQMDTGQLVGHDLPPLQYVQDRQHLFGSTNSLPSCALERQTPSEQEAGKQQLIQHASPVSHTQDENHSPADTFNSIQQQNTPRQGNCSTENLHKYKSTHMSSAHLQDSSCHFHRSLTSLATDFPFSAPNAPMISVDPPSQTLLPSVGYSPPGLSNHGLSPNLFSPIGLGHAEQSTAHRGREDPNMQVAASSAETGVGCSASGVDMGAGFSSVPASVLDMLLLKADISAVEMPATTGGQSSNSAAPHNKHYDPTTARTFAASVFPTGTLTPQSQTVGTSLTAAAFPRTTAQSQLVSSFSSPTSATLTNAVFPPAAVMQSGTVPTFTSAAFPIATAQPQSMTASSLPALHSLMPVSNPETVSASSEDCVPVFTGQFCLECNKMCTEACKHGCTQYQHVDDKPVLTRARATLPACLMFGQSSTTGHFNTTGVFTTTALESKTEFGPLQGKLLPKSDTDSAANFTRWKIFYDGTATVLDISDENDSNWMMFVKPARNAMERNIVAFQRSHHIMFITSKDVQPGTELLFWFSPDYCKMLCGINKPPAFCPYCPVCSQVFLDRGQLRRHTKQVHESANVRKWSCSVCSVQFRSTGRLNEHVMTQHMHLKPYICPTCGKEFADSRNLKTHLAMHTGTTQICMALAGMVHGSEFTEISETSFSFDFPYNCFRRRQEKKSLKVKNQNFEKKPLLAQHQSCWLT